MFDLKPIGTRVDCAREEFEYRRTRKRASDEQIVRYVFFAGNTLNWPTSEMLSTAEANLKALGGLTRQWTILG